MKTPARFVALLLCLTALGTTPASAQAAVRWSTALRQKSDWYAGDEGRAMTASVIQYQTKSGGWPKNTDFSDPPTEEFLEDQRLDHRAATIDNNATTTPLRFLAKRLAATDDPAARAAFERGFDYLLAAQYENGGWPQYFPLQKGYYTRITYNDNAMVNVLTLLRDAAQGRAPFGFLDEARRAKAAQAVLRGIDCILRTQIRDAEGHPTAWCAQHDEVTLAPAWARNFEPPSLSGAESAGITKFLMEIEAPSPEVIAAVRGAVRWFEKVKITGLRYETFTDAEGKKDRRVVPDADAEPIWARFYELGTDRPIFIGRDKVIRYALAEIERERRAGYGYYGTGPASVLDRDLARWETRVARLDPPASVPASTSASAPASAAPASTDR